MQNLKYGRAICYSGYRIGQSPATKKYPTYDQIKEDLFILEKDYDYIRMYDPSKHAEIALNVIRTEQLNMKVMLGIDLMGEAYNDKCQWGGKYSDAEVKRNIKYNEQQLKQLIDLANIYEDIIVSVSAGNEAVPEWNENLVTPKRVLYFVNQLKKNTKQLVTYCENSYYWNTHLQEVAEAVDIISVHTYPVWIGKTIDEGIPTSIHDFERIRSFYPNKACIITEAGWPTKSSGRGIKPENAGIDFQARYHKDMSKWSQDNQVVVFFFEAFDEPWKGSSNPDEPEKHWGIYTVNRELKNN